MDKQTKLYIGIGLLGVGAYLYFRSTKNMVNASGLPRVLPKPKGSMPRSPRGTGGTMPRGGTSAYGGGQYSPGPIGIPTCPACSKDGKCVDRSSAAYGTSAPIVNCVNAQTGGAYGGGQYSSGTGGGKP